MYVQAVVVVQLLLLYLEPLVYDTIRDIANINLHSSAEHISVCWPHYIMTDMLAEVSSWSVLYWFPLRTKQETHIRCNLSLSATTDIIMSNSESGPQELPLWWIYRSVHFYLTILKLETISKWNWLEITV